MNNPTGINPLISVIMPVYNAEEYVAEAISSILGQTFRNFEFIIINDGSTDNSLHEINRFGDERIILIDQTDNRGNYFCRNLGLSLAKGKYICVMDADDISLPKRLEAQYNFMENNPAYLAAGSYVLIFSETTEQLLKRETLGDKIRKKLRRDNVCTHPSLIIRKEVFTKYKISYNEKYKYCADYNLLIDISQIGEITNIPEVLLKYRISKKQISSEKRRDQQFYKDKIIEDRFNSQFNGTNVFLLEVSPVKIPDKDNTLEILARGLESSESVNLFRIRFIPGNLTFFNQKENTYTIGYQKDKIELLNSFNGFLYYMTSHLFENKKNVILHLHTLNLIDYAVYVKNKIGCKIISHLYYVPWKNYFYSDPQKFNRLYEGWIEKKINPSLYITQPCEEKAYSNSDRIIATSHSGSEFLARLGYSNVSVVPGCKEDVGCKKEKPGSEKFLMIGYPQRKEGFQPTLDAMQKLIEKGYGIHLTICGYLSCEDKKMLEQEYPQIKTTLLGPLPSNRLKEIYEANDIAIITSLQSPSVDIAIGAAMAGMPLITTALDGIEIFEHEIHSLKIPVSYSTSRGLYLDTTLLLNEMEKIIQDQKLRENLGKNIRQLYQEKYTPEKMIASIKNIYHKVKQ